MNLLRGFGLLIIAVVLFLADSSSALPWWETARFTPHEKTIEGIPVQAIDHHWKLASVLTESMLPPEAAKPGDDSFAEHVARYGGAFTIRGDFDRDGRLEEALVGVYEDESGEFGEFLIIVEPSKARRPKLEAVFKEPDEAGFSVLTYRDGNLGWWFCLYCDDGHPIVATGADHYKLGPGLHD